jgi:hypothetical protein
MPEDTRDIAISLRSTIEAHIKDDDRRHGEISVRLEKMFTYLKDAHEGIDKKIDDIQGTLAEQRGAGKATKAILGVVATVMGAVGGIVGTHLNK